MAPQSRAGLMLAVAFGAAFVSSASADRLTADDPAHVAVMTPESFPYLQAQWGAGWGPLQIPYAAGVAVDPMNERVYVGQSIYRRVQKLTLDGRALAEWNTPGQPAAIAVSRDGFVYVAEPAENAVLEYDSSGVFVRSLSVPTPNGVGVDDLGRVYVVEYGSAANDPGTVHRFDPAGVEMGSWAVGRSPRGLAVDPRGFVVVTCETPSQLATELQTYTLDGARVGGWVGDSEDYVAVAPDGAGNYYLSVSQRVEKRNSTGVLQSTTGGSGGLAYDFGRSLLYVTTGPADQAVLERFGPTPGLPPVANAGPPATAECQGGLTRVPLDASASADPEGSTLTYRWWTDSPGALVESPNSRTPKLRVTSGSSCDVTCTVYLEVTDLTHASGTSSTTVRIVDTTPPALRCTAQEIVPAAGDPSSPRGARAFRLAVATGDLCGAPAVQAFVDEGCRQTPVRPGERFEVDGTDACGTRSAVLRVRTIDGCGNASTWSQTLIGVAGDDGDVTPRRRRSGTLAENAAASTGSALALRIRAASRAGCTLEYALPSRGAVDVGFFDLAGRRLAVIDRGERDGGIHAANFRGRLSPGAYFVRLTAAGRVLGRTLLIR